MQQITLKEAAARYGVERRTLNNAVLWKHLPAERAGPVWLVRPAAVEKWLASGRPPRGRPPKPEPRAKRGAGR